jgi:hypothetical protein
MKGTRLFSIVGGLLLIIAAFLPYGFSAWASGSTFQVTMDVLNRINDQASMLNLLQQVGLSNTLSAIMLGFVVVTFFLLLVGGILALVKTGGGSIAGPVGMVLLTVVPIIVGPSSAITSLGIGYWIGWVGAIICVIGTAGKSKLAGINLFVNQNQNVNVQSPAPASQPPPPPT